MHLSCFPFFQRRENSTKSYNFIHTIHSLQFFGNIQGSIWTSIVYDDNFKVMATGNLKKNVFGMSFYILKGENLLKIVYIILYKWVLWQDLGQEQKHFEGPLGFISSEIRQLILIPWQNTTEINPPTNICNIVFLFANRKGLGPNLIESWETLCLILIYMH